MTGPMPRWRLFKVWGHTIYMEPLFLLIVAVFTLSGVTNLTSLLHNLAFYVPALFIGVVWHELGHALATQKLGYGTSTIVLHGLGGVAISRSGARPPKHSIIISLAGPIFSFSLTLVFGLAAYFYPNDDLLSVAFEGIAWVNIVLGVFNLLPINPLDGGHVLLHSLRHFMKKNHKALLYTTYVSLVFVALLVVVALVGPFGGMFMILIALMLGFQNFQTLRQLKTF